MGVPTHVMQFSSGGAAVKDGGSSLLQFVSPLRQLDGAERWFITFYALPEGRSFEEVRGQATEQFLQAAGRSDAMTVEIRKLAAGQSRVGWVRYTVGHEHDGTLPLDVAIPLPTTSRPDTRCAPSRGTPQTET
ncbi:hypothetical protein [Mycolicibacterium arenosum]|uniref:Uncharacterized protein n=1 Tax=Mycolicibacterium arenosum TaxID=2952157 RepID=A0ABT1M5F1_9MYCO|nr:hypothetical protein [Mycolicibacterium sp. CAU 1645]MCP9274390.1 hypothetical protein [Mycolicibacterium sp. CAU 1645]